MKQRNLLSFTLSQCLELYRTTLLDVYQLARDSDSVAQFKRGLERWIATREDVGEESVAVLKRLLEYDSKEVYELSTEQHLCIDTVAQLYRFLQGETDEHAPIDLYLDLYHLLSFSGGRVDRTMPAKRFKSALERWELGTDADVVQMRKENKERMIHLLIQKIEHRKNGVRFCFEPLLSYEEKYSRVVAWWDDFRFHLAMAIKSPSELNLFLGDSLSCETRYLLRRARKKGMPFFITPYYLSLLNTTEAGYDDRTIRSYILYSPDMVQTYGSIRAWEKEDEVEPGKPNAAGWVLPDGNNIHRRYPEVAILIPDTMGRACGGLCASCQRMYDFQSRRLNFEFDALRPKESWEKKLRRLMTYFEEDRSLCDILITGGDALMSQNKTLRSMLDAVYRMAQRKRKANLLRADGEKYAEMQRVRLGSRLPAYLPMRVNDELVEILHEFKVKAMEVGVTQFVVQTHFQSPLEVTPEAVEAIRRILSAGWIVTNQLVYTVAASRRGHTARLRQTLNAVGVICYYTFSVKGFEENRAVFTPISRSMQEQYEEKVFGLLTAEQQEQLAARVESGDPVASTLRRFMREHHLPFLSTDRSVLNLPAIGKSMTFALVGFMPDGRRILRFEHDATRCHSPIIDQMEHVYIVENKSIAAYLRHLQLMGESPEEYATIWRYTQGKTEPRFRLFNYQDGAKR